MKNLISIVSWVFLCLLSGYIANIFQSDAIAEWYPSLVRSPLSPPDWVFPLAWTLLYILMGISVGMLYGIRSIYTRFLYPLFMIQLFLNFMWSLLFFYMRNPALGFADIILLDIFVVIYFAGAYVVNRSSALLFIPYILWLAFATYLNGYIMMYN